MKKGLILTVCILLFLIVIFLLHETVSYAGYLFADFLNIRGFFARKFIHHAVQLLIALIIILPLKYKCKQDFGLKSGDTKTGIRYLAIYTLIISVFFALLYYYQYSTIPNIGYDYPVNAKNILSDLSFQLFMSGPSEELLFRALPITLFIILFKRSIKIVRGLTLETLLAALLFALAHLDSPKLDFQIYYSFILGIAFGITYQKTGSILYPACMHSISNIISVGFGYLFYKFF